MLNILVYPLPPIDHTLSVDHTHHDDPGGEGQRYGYLSLHLPTRDIAPITDRHVGVGVFTTPVQAFGSEHMINAFASHGGNDSKGTCAMGVAEKHISGMNTGIPFAYLV